MAHTEARAWWAEVQHLRDDYERTDEARRRADETEERERRERDDRNHELEAGVAPGRDRAPDGPGRWNGEPASGRLRSTRSRFDDPAPVARRGEHAPAGPYPGRRTVEIRGRTVPAPPVPRSTELTRRRPPRGALERIGPHPDRLAMWALFMGILLIVVAIGTAGH